MAITTNWKGSRAEVVGRETEVVVPLAGAGDISGIYQQSVVDKVAAAGIKAGLYRTASIDFESGELHIVGSALDAAKIKPVIDAEIETTNQWVDAQERQSQEFVERVRKEAARREQETKELGDQFRAD